VETRLPVDAGPGRSSLRPSSTIRLTLEFRQPSDLRRLGRIGQRAESLPSRSHPERIPLARFFETIASGKSKSVLRCFRHYAPIERPRTARAANAAGWPSTRFSRRRNVLNCPPMAQKEKRRGGSAQPFEKAQNGQGNQRKSKPWGKVMSGKNTTGTPRNGCSAIGRPAVLFSVCSGNEKGPCGPLENSRDWSAQNDGRLHICPPSG
jgi:hypothetical protein